MKIKVVFSLIIIVNALVTAACTLDNVPENETTGVIPTKLSDRHELNHFETYENSDDLTVVHAYGSEPYVSFKVIIGANIYIENYKFETNHGVKYNVALLEDGMYQACWSYRDDYYTLVIDDKDTLTYIMENLQESGE